MRMKLCGINVIELQVELQVEEFYSIIVNIANLQMQQNRNKMEV